MVRWKLAPEASHLNSVFSSLDAAFTLQGERITKDNISKVNRVTIDGIRYYIKLYTAASTGYRKLIAEPRVKKEWRNLRYFKNWGIPTANIIAWGLERKNGCFSRGALVSQEIPNTIDLAQLANEQHPCLKDPQWVNQISLQLANITRTMHEHKFAHNDLKWRNVLVDDQNNLFLIDCPSGKFWFGPFLTFRKIKDLACLDKVAKYHLSRTQRLRFYLQYMQQKCLTRKDKRRIQQIITLYKGRE